jgi:hypothetical protein
MTRPSLENRRVIGYGGGLAALVTIETSGLACEMLVDRSSALQGQRLAGVPICPPEQLEQLVHDGNRDDFFVIVFAYDNRAISAIFSHLSSLGLSHGKHYTDASTFHFHTMGRRLENQLELRPDAKLFESIRALSLYSTLPNKSSIAGAWLLQELLRRQAASVAGDIAECGVYTGGNAYLTIALAGDRLGRRSYHLLDSFEGLPEFSTHDPASRSGEFSDVSLASVRDLFSHFEAARVHVGWFSDTLPMLADREFALVYVDCDVYEPTVECCEFFYPRMPQGGMLLFHDYWHSRAGMPPGSREPFTGIAKAVDEFVAKTGDLVVNFPETTHALLIKGRKVEGRRA